MSLDRDDAMRRQEATEEMIRMRDARAVRAPWRRSVGSDRDKMSLPLGMTCGDCRHLDTCTAMFGHTAADEVCDWSPSRFSYVRRMVAGDIGVPA